MADFEGDPWPTAEQLLLLRAALLPGEEGISAYREWRTRVDPQGDFGWSVVRLLPLVYDRLHRQGVQDALMARLRGVYRRAWYENHRLFHETAPTVAALAAAGCPLLMLKGAPLVFSYYRNHALRPMSDLDLVVPQDRLATAFRVLRDAGYVPERPESADLVRFRHALSYFHPGGAQIDLHWHVLFEAPHRAATEECWARAEPATFQGTAVRQPDPTHFLVQTVVHGMRSNEEPPIRWIPDAMAILDARGGDIDWQRLVAFAREQRITARLRLGLAFLRERFHAPVPGRALAGLDRPATWVERVENTVMLAHPLRFTRGILGTQWVSFTEYCRFAQPGGPLAFTSGYTEFLRFRLGLNGRREILPLILRGLGRRFKNGGEGVAA